MRNFYLSSCANTVSWVGRRFHTQRAYWLLCWRGLQKPSGMTKGPLKRGWSTVQHSLDCMQAFHSVLQGSLTGTPGLSPWYWFLGKLPLWTYLHVGVSGGTPFPHPMICSVPQGLGQPIYYLPAHFVRYKASSGIHWWCRYLFHEHHGKESHVSCRKNIGVVNPSKCCGLQLQETLIMSTRRNYLGILERYLSMTPHVNVHSQIT